MLSKISALLVFTACLLVEIPGYGQSNNSAADTRKSSNPGEPVLILHALCARPASAAQASDKSCETVITKADFDTLTAALDPNMPQSNRLVLATEYSKLLVLGQEAERLKLDQDPAFKQLLDFTRLQLLERQLVRAVEAESSSISQAEIAQYYREHPSSFEEGSFLKLYMPKQGKWLAPEPAQTMQQRAAAGENFDKLQQEIWAALGRPSGAPLTQMGTLRRSNLPEGLQKIFALKPGEVSAVIADKDGSYVYRMESKRVIPLESAGSEIRTLMANLRLQDRISKLRSAVMVSVNEDYFGALPSTEELARHHGMEHQGSHLMPMSNDEKKSQMKQ
jgi:PPIC-type PPIASE domain